jgi:CSLREA domain-containing protein
MIMTTKKMFRHLPVVLFHSLVVFAIAAGYLSFPVRVRAQGLAIEVNTAADNIANDGRCSLREAIINANKNWQFHQDCTSGFASDGIFFSNALGAATITLNSPLPAVTDPQGLTIMGGDDIAVSGNNQHQVFAITMGGSLTLESLTVRNGNSTITNLGGGAYNTATLIIRNSTFEGNNAQHGGAVFTGSGTTLTIENSNFLSNSTGENGGAIYNETGTVTIQGGIFSGNTAMYGGSIANLGSQSGQITITGSTFEGNTSSDSGGAIHNGSVGSINILNVNFIENASVLGGAIYNLGKLMIVNSDLSGNSGWYAGGLYNDRGEVTIMESDLSKNLADHGAGIYNIKGALTITESTFAENIGDGIFNESGTVEVARANFSNNRGNGIHNHSGTSILESAVLRMTDSTFSKNLESGIYNDYAKNNISRTTFYGNANSGIHNINGSVVTVSKSTFESNSAFEGGAIHNASTSILNLQNNTFVMNFATARGGALYNSAEAYGINNTFSENEAKYGGGIYNSDPGELQIDNTILANSLLGGDCLNVLGQVTGINNLIESVGGDACSLINGVDGNIIGSDPNLGTLTGSPSYYPLNGSSLGIDNGDDGQCAAALNESQNGVTRPQGKHCDIGSYEAP